MPITVRPDLIFTKGSGSYIWDEKSNNYLDFVQGWAVNCLGHSPPVLVDAIVAQARRLINCSPAFYNQPMPELAGLIVAHSCFTWVFFANSGAEANEGAIKLARKWGQLHRCGAHEIITFEHAFHGRTLATMSASDKPGWDALYEPKVPGFPTVPLNDLAAVEAAITPDTVAVMLEPIQGEAGVFPATDEFMRDLRKLTTREGILLIVDEIQTGIGRTGRLFAYQHSGIEPDIMTLGKGLGGGVPLTALAAREEVCCFAPGDQGGTFNGNPLMTAAGHRRAQNRRRTRLSRRRKRKGAISQSTAAAPLRPLRLRRRPWPGPAPRPRPEKRDRRTDRRPRPAKRPPPQRPAP